MSKRKADSKGSSTKVKHLPRSRVLVLNKETEEPKDILFVQTTGKPWLLILTDDVGRNRGKLFKTMKKARKAAKRIAKAHPDLEVTVVSRRVGYGPPRSRVSDERLREENDRGSLWCPYCRKFRVFDWDPTWDIDKCPVCRIPINNFHVIRNNPRLSWEHI